VRCLHSPRVALSFLHGHAERGSDIYEIWLAAPSQMRDTIGWEALRGKKTKSAWQYVIRSAAAK
jgi:hypothetical protein